MRTWDNKNIKIIQYNSQAVLIIWLIHFVLIRSIFLLHFCLLFTMADWLCQITWNNRMWLATKNIPFSSILNFQITERKLILKNPTLATEEYVLLQNNRVILLSNWTDSIKELLTNITRLSGREPIQVISISQFLF